MRYKFVFKSVHEVEAEGLERAQAILAIDLRLGQGQAQTWLEVFDEEGTELPAELDGYTMAIQLRA